MAAIDLGFVLAVVAFGWGLSLATYRRFARHSAGPWGHGSSSARGCRRARRPPVLLAMLFALARGYGGYGLSAAMIPVFGLAWAVFWTGFLRVGAQSALLLAPPPACCCSCAG